MNLPRLLAVALAAGVMFVCACSDNTSSGGGSSGGSSSSDSSTEGRKPADTRQPDDNGEDGDDEDGADTVRRKPPVDEADPAAPVGGTPRGNDDSKQKQVTKLEGKEIKSGEIYRGGERVKSSLLGLSIRVPDGSISAWSSDSQAIQIRQEGADAAAFLIPRTGITRAEARKALGDEVDLGQVKMPAKGGIKEEGDFLWRVYGNQSGIMVITFVLAQKTSVMMLAQGADYTEKAARAYTKLITDGIQYAEPADAEARVQWERTLMGNCLHVFKYRSSSGGGSSMSWETNIWWHLGSDHTYIYSYRYTGSGSVTGRNQFGSETYWGGSATDNNNDHQGTWRIEHSMTGPFLILLDTAGATRMYPLKTNGRQVYIDGDEVSISRSDKKR